MTRKNDTKFKFHGRQSFSWKATPLAITVLSGFTTAAVVVVTDPLPAMS